MYRVRLGGGEVAVFKNAEELARAVGSGMVGPDAQVFHSARGCWIPVHVHPDYPPAASRGTELPGAENLRDPGREPRPLSRQVHAWQASLAEDHPSQDWGSLGIDISKGWLGPGLVIAAALGTVLLMALGSRSLKRSLLARAGEAPPSALETTSGMTSAPIQRALSGAPAPAGPQGDVPTLQARAQAESYFEAYADAWARMDRELALAEFRDVFAVGRFAAPESVRAGRQLIEAARRAVRHYQDRETVLEQSYRPAPRESLRERADGAEAARALLSDADSLFGLMGSQEGRYVYDRGSVAFDNAEAARRYAVLRRSIISTVESWRDSSMVPETITLPRLLRDWGDGEPPQVHE